MDSDHTNADIPAEDATGCQTFHLATLIQRAMPMITCQPCNATLPDHTEARKSLAEHRTSLRRRFGLAAAPLRPAKGVLFEPAPEILRTPVCPPGTGVHCLDNRIWLEKTQIVHSVYDRRKEFAAFRNIATFPHRTTQLHIDIKRAVVESQLLRFARRSTKWRDFTYSSAQLIARFVAHKYKVGFVEKPASGSRKTEVGQGA